MTPEMGKFLPGPCSAGAPPPSEPPVGESQRSVGIISGAVGVNLEPILFPVGWLLWPEPLCV